MNYFIRQTKRTDKFIFILLLAFYHQMNSFIKQIKETSPLIPLSQIQIRSYFATSYPGIRLLILGLMPTFLPPEILKVQQWKIHATPKIFSIIQIHGRDVKCTCIFNNWNGHTFTLWFTFLIIHKDTFRENSSLSKENCIIYL